MEFRRLLEIDQAASSRLRLLQSARPLFTAAALLAHSGDSWFWLAALGLVWIFGSPWWHRWSALLIVGILFLATLVLAVKFSIRRRRPEGEWGSIYRNTDPHSFPSGHAARAGLLAVLGIFLGPPWFALAVLAWAPLVSLARVATGLHFLSDVIAGLVLGILAGVALATLSPLLLHLFPYIF